MAGLEKTRLWLSVVLLLYPVYSQKINVAILEFDAANISSAEVRILIGRLSSELFKYNKFTVIERSQMEEVLNEQGFQQSGCTSTECVVEVGRLLGVDGMITGTIGRIGSLYTVSARVISVETGQIEDQVSVDVEGTIETLLTETMAYIAAKLSGETGIQSTVASSMKASGQKNLAELDLDPKKAFYRSLLIPGSFQRYVDDPIINSKKTGNWQLGLTIFSWLMVGTGNDMANGDQRIADKLFATDPDGLTETFEDDDGVAMTAVEWQKEADVSKGMVKFFIGVAIALHINSAFKAKGLAERYSKRKGNISFQFDPYKSNTELVFSYNFNWY